MTQTPAAVRTAADVRLTGALRAALEVGDLPPCTRRDGGLLWLSEDFDDRDLAASCCAGCPILTECGAAAEENDERFGVWGGVDRTPTKRTRAAA